MSEAEGIKIIANNPRGRGDFFIEEVVEAGIVLRGTEVKSLRSQTPSLREAYVEVRKSGASLEAWLIQAHIPPYAFGNINNHEPLRARKLLLHSHQIEKLFGAVRLQGLSIVPLKMYFKKGRAKVELGYGKGKKKGDQREAAKKKQAGREMDRAVKSRNR